jgi:hypothetical protein
MIKNNIARNFTLLFCALSIPTVWAREPEPFPVPKYQTYPAADEAAFLQEIMSHKRIRAQGDQFKQIIDTGYMTFKAGGVPKQARFTKVMIDYLRYLDAQNVSMDALFAYDAGAKVDSAHTRLGLWASPEEDGRYINHGIDITSFNRQAVAAFDPDSTATAVVSAIDNLPPGKYELGLPREAYPNHESNAKGSWKNDIKNYFVKGKRNFNPNLVVWRMDLNEGFINEEKYAPYRRFMPWYTNEFLNKKDAKLIEDMKWMTPEDQAALKKALDQDNHVEMVRYLMRDRSIGHRVADAMARAKKKGVSFRGIYGDALDHLHITVVEVNVAPPATPEAEEPVSPLQEQAVENPGTGKTFVPFTAADLDRAPTAVDSRIEKLPGGGVRMRNEKGEIIYEASADEWLAQLNAQEKRLTDLGHSTRDAGDITAHEIPTDVNRLREQLLNELGLNAPGLLSKVLDPLPHCPNINSSKLPSALLEQSVELPDGTQLSFGNFLDRVADTQSMLCSIGYSLLDQSLVNEVENLASMVTPQAGSSPRSGTGFARTFARSAAPVARSFGAAQDVLNQVVSQIMSRRDEIFDSLGLSSLAKGLNLEAFNKLGEFSDIAKDIQDVLEGKAKVGPEMLNDLKNALGVQERVDQLIPHMPDFQLPGKPKRTPLKVKKQKRWDGLNIGKRDILAMEGFAELVMGGTEEDQTLRADAQSNFYVFGQDINILDALGELSAAPKEVKAHLHMRIVGKDLFKPIDEAASVNLTFEDPSAFTFNKREGFSQTFMIGPIPVAVSAGGVIDLGLGYRLGLVTTQVQGAVVPHASIGGYAQAGVGFSGFLSAGAGAEITVLKFEAPVTGGAKLLFDPEGYPFLRVFIDTDCSLELLNGRIYAFAEFPVPFEIKKETLDIWKFKGPQFQHKIMSWNIDIGHEGSKMGGDIVDQADQEETASIQQAISLDNRKEELEAYRTRLRAYADQVFQTVLDEQLSQAGQDIQRVGGNIERADATMISQIEEFNRNLNSF